MAQSNSVRMRRGQSVREYYDHIKSMLTGAKDAMKAKFGDQYNDSMYQQLKRKAIDLFIKGLFPDMSIAVDAKKPQTLEAAYKEASLVEQRMIAGIIPDTRNQDRPIHRTYVAPPGVEASAYPKKAAVIKRIQDQSGADSRPERGVRGGSGAELPIVIPYIHVIGSEKRNQYPANIRIPVHEGRTPWLTFIISSGSPVNLIKQRALADSVKIDVHRKQPLTGITNEEAVYSRGVVQMQILNKPAEFLVVSDDFFATFDGMLGSGFLVERSAIVSWRDIIIDGDKMHPIPYFKGFTPDPPSEVLSRRSAPPKYKSNENVRADRQFVADFNDLVVEERR